MAQKPLLFYWILVFAYPWLWQMPAFGESPIALEITEKPQGIYSENTTILYQVRLHFPSGNGQSLRLLPPNPNLENLEFLGISQEVSASSDSQTGLEQILTFRFRPLKTGPSKIHKIELTWAREDGSGGPSLEIPSAAFVIRKSFPAYAPWAALTALGAAALTVFLIRKKQKPVSSPIPEKTLEEIVLTELALLGGEIKRGKTAEFLDRLNKMTERYLAQKLDWNGLRDGYNTLAPKAEREWGRKDAQALEEFLKTLERLRFSGEEVPEYELVRLYQTIVSLIEKKKTV